MSIGTINNHREREKGVLVYPVYSRRTGGLSIGINLFPVKKLCNFDCPYCEVFPFSTGNEFSINRMEDDLRSSISEAIAGGMSIGDICFSGNGEPTMSPDLPGVLELADNIRSEMAPAAGLVLITNGTGLLNQSTFSLLEKSASVPMALDIWLKLDAGTEQWYKKMNRSNLPFDKITAAIKAFATCAPVTIQTMLCAIDGSAPPPGEAEAWEKLLADLAGHGHVRKVQLYGKARPAPEDPLAEALPDEHLEERAASLRKILSEAAPAAQPPVEVYL